MSFWDIVITCGSFAAAAFSGLSFGLVLDDILYEKYGFSWVRSSLILYGFPVVFALIWWTILVEYVT